MEIQDKESLSDTIDYIAGIVDKVAIGVSQYVGDTYYDPQPIYKGILFNSGLDVKVQPIREQMSFISDNDIDNMVNKFKEYVQRIEKYDANGSEIRTFQEVSAIVKDIREYVAKNGGNVVIDDDPIGCYFGYKCNTNVKWRISHQPVLDYFSDPHNPPDVLDVHYLNGGERGLSAGFITDVMARGSEPLSKPETPEERNVRRMKKTIDLHQKISQDDKDDDDKFDIDLLTKSLANLAKMANTIKTDFDGDFHRVEPEETIATHTDYVWTNPEAMMQDIMLHVSKYGNDLLIADDIDQMQYGWLCAKTEQQWYIDINNMNRFLDKNDATKQSLLTSKGRQKFIDSFDSSIPNDAMYALADDGKTIKCNDFPSKLSWTRWTDIGEMFKDIREHGKINGRAIIQNDQPKQLRIGFTCTNTGKSWSIRISELSKYWQDSQKSKDKDQRTKGDLLHRAFSTTDGRENLIQSLNKGDASPPSKGINPLFLLAGAALGGFLASLNKPTEVRIEEEDNIDMKMQEEIQEEQEV